MRTHKNRILILCFMGILIVGFGVWRPAEAVDSSIYVSPAQASKEIGDTFDISVKVNPSGQKVCVVEGKMTLTKLSCQKVTMGSGISAQTSPSCDDLSFLLGIQGCAISEKTLFTVRVKAKSAGSGTAKFTGVDIIGEGVSFSSASSGGSYDISSGSCECGLWGPWENEDGVCGGGVCYSSQRLQSRSRVCTPSVCDIEKQARCVYDSTCVPSAPAAETEEVQEEREIVEVPIEELERLLEEPLGTTTREQEEIVQGPEEGIEEPIEEIEFAESMPRASFLANVGMAWRGITQSALLTATLILCLMGLVAVGARGWWMSRKKRDK